MSAAKTIWITRASPGAEALADRLIASGFTPLICPLILTEPLADVVWPGGSYPILAVTSAVAVRHMANMTDSRHHKVFAVGQATASAAKASGWKEVLSAEGDSRALADLILKHKRLSQREPCPAKAFGPVLYPCAREPFGDLAGRLRAQGLEITSLPIYQTRPRALDPVLGELRSPFQQPDFWERGLFGIFLQSPSAARALGPVLEKLLQDGWLASLSRRSSARASRPLIFALSSACAQSLEIKSHELRACLGKSYIAASPHETSLLELVKQVETQTTEVLR